MADFITALKNWYRGSKQAPAPAKQYSKQAPADGPLNPGYVKPDIGLAAQGEINRRAETNPWVRSSAIKPTGPDYKGVLENINTIQNLEDTGKGVASPWTQQGTVNEVTDTALHGNAVKAPGAAQPVGQVPSAMQQIPTDKSGIPGLSKKQSLLASIQLIKRATEGLINGKPVSQVIPKSPYADFPVYAEGANGYASAASKASPVPAGGRINGQPVNKVLPKINNSASTPAKKAPAPLPPKKASHTLRKIAEKANAEAKRKADKKQNLQKDLKAEQMKQKVVNGVQKVFDAPLAAGRAVVDAGKATLNKGTGVLRSLFGTPEQAAAAPKANTAPAAKATDFVSTPVKGALKEMDGTGKPGPWKSNIPNQAAAPAPAIKPADPVKELAGKSTQQHLQGAVDQVPLKPTFAGRLGTVDWNNAIMPGLAVGGGAAALAALLSKKNRARNTILAGLGGAALGAAGNAAYQMYGKKASHQFRKMAGIGQLIDNIKQKVKPYTPSEIVKDKVSKQILLPATKTLVQVRRSGGQDMLDRIVSKAPGVSVAQSAIVGGAAAAPAVILASLLSPKGKKLRNAAIAGAGAFGVGAGADLIGQGTGTLRQLASALTQGGAFYKQHDSALNELNKVK